MLRLLVTILLALALAGCQSPATDNAGWQPGDPTPIITMSKENAQFTVTNIHNGPLSLSDVQILNEGCGWTTTNGHQVRIGDVIACTQDDVLTLAHGPSGTRIYTNCGGCTSSGTSPAKPSDTKPNISFTKDSSARTLTVASADSDADWHDIRSDSNCQPTYSGRTIGDGKRVATSSDPVGAGDKLHMMSAPCSIKLTHIPTGQIYNTWSFS